MILVAIAILSLMGFANYWLGRQFLYPPAVFCTVWAAELVLVRLAGNFFYPMTDETLAIFCSYGEVFRPNPQPVITCCRLLCAIRCHVDS